MREKDPSVPNLPEGRNPIFFVYPISMAISLIIGIFWLAAPNFRRLIVMTLAGCAVGSIMMLSAGIVEMRHCEIYIDLERVSDAELTDHPVFLHNFFMCIISIVCMLFYVVHFWITYDCWRWQKKESTQETTIEESSPSSQAPEHGTEQISMGETATKEEYEPSEDLERIPPWDLIKKRMSDVDEKDLEVEPAILYCCFVDCWRYVRDRNDRKPIHEFQVVHIK